MQQKNVIPFVLSSIAAGLIAAYLAVNFSSPEETANPGNQHANTLSLGRSQGPVSYADAVKRATPSVVNIYTAKVTVQRGNSLFSDPIFERFFGERFNSRPKKRLQTSLGSGVIFNKQGYILTNHHVVADADQIKVVLASGKELNAVIVGSDPETDLAVLQTGAENLPAIPLGDSAGLQVGDVVLAIGNPFGVGQTVTMGIVGATGRNRLGLNTFENFIQTDAAINPGNSGGALINAHGKLIGINTAIFSKSGGSHGIGFAIPAALANSVLEQIVEHGRVIRGWLGIAGQDVTQELAESFDLSVEKGVIVSGVLEDGPADQIDIRPGDIITRIGDQDPSSASQILNYISTLKPGTKIKMEVWRNAQRHELEITVSERPRS